jgi:hypothetical protein
MIDTDDGVGETDSWRPRITTSSVGGEASAAEAEAR